MKGESTEKTNYTIFTKRICIDVRWATSEFTPVESHTNDSSGLGS